MKVVFFLSFSVYSKIKYPVANRVKLAVQSILENYLP